MAVINVFLGWTFIGWVIALAMAVSRPPQPLYPPQFPPTYPPQPPYPPQQFPPQPPAPWQ